MHNSFKIYFLVIPLLVCNCKTSKRTDAENQGNDTTEEMKALLMKENGFLSGTLQMNRSVGCSYILTVDSYKDILDPVNLQDFYKTDIPQKVWVKYNSLRMKNRCKEARPVSITAIEQRRE